MSDAGGGDSRKRKAPAHDANPRGKVCLNNGGKKNLHFTYFTIFFLVLLLLLPFLQNKRTETAFLWKKKKTCNLPPKVNKAEYHGLTRE